MQDYVTYEDLFLFAGIIIQTVTVCYLIFKKKK